MRGGVKWQRQWKRKRRKKDKDSGEKKWPVEGWEEDLNDKDNKKEKNKKEKKSGEKKRPIEGWEEDLNDKDNEKENKQKNDKNLAKRNCQLKVGRRTLLDAENNQSGTKRGAWAWEGEHQI